MVSNRLTSLILVGLATGAAGGWLVNTQFPDSAAVFATNAALLPLIFLRLIKMIIAPLVFSTLAVGLGLGFGLGLGRMSDVATVGRVGG